MNQNFSEKTDQISEKSLEQLCGKIGDTNQEPAD